jgi:DNA mismatch repair ATPase MutS
MRLFTCINVSDSLADGFSYFYAEVRRLKQLLDATNESEELPVLYLIDEIFRGTNNKERLIGSQSYVKALSQSKGFGIVSTHDLELVKLEDNIGELKNYHFRESIEQGKMKFEYQIHEGPSPTTNALRIMQLEGLPVPTPETE